MSATAQYSSIPATASVIISTANTNRDGTGTLGVLLTAGANGSRVDDITINATGTTTAGMVRLFASDGTNHRMIQEIPVSALTPSGTVQAFAVKLSALGIVLKTSWSLRASTHNAESFALVVTNAGDL